MFSNEPTKKRVSGYVCAGHHSSLASSGEQGDGERVLQSKINIKKINYLKLLILLKVSKYYTHKNRCWWLLPGTFESKSIGINFNNHKESFAKQRLKIHPLPYRLKKTRSTWWWLLWLLVQSLHPGANHTQVMLKLLDNANINTAWMYLALGTAHNDQVGHR